MKQSRMLVELSGEYMGRVLVIRKIALDFSAEIANAFITVIDVDIHVQFSNPAADRLLDQFSSPAADRSFLSSKDRQRLAQLPFRVFHHEVELCYGCCCQVSPARDRAILHIQH